MEKTGTAGILKVEKRDGRIIAFDEARISRAIGRAFADEGMEDNGNVQIISNFVLSELEKKFAEKIPSVEEIQDIVEETLMRKGFTKVAKTYILYRAEHAKTRETRKAVVGTTREFESKVSLNGLRVLKERYLLKDDSGRVVETPDEMFMRVANNLAIADTNYGSSEVEMKKTAGKFYSLMSSLKFLPNAPTLYNAGTKIQQLSACFVLPIEDDIRGIYTTLLNQAIIHQSGGGTGFDFSRLRPKGSIVRSTKGIASGPVSFLRVYNASTQEIKQGGKRRGANMGILRVDHPDILEFINCKEKNTDITNFNISVAITRKFMDAVKADRDYELIEPHTGRVSRTESAKRVFDLLVAAAWRNGDPGVIFIDRINDDNPTPQIGAIESTNPCGEVPLLPYESCNLGSINLSKFVAGSEFNWKELEETIRIAVHLLDNVIDMNHYPLPEIEKITKANRKIGLGIMGWAESLYLLGIPYNSEKAIDLAGKLMSFIRSGADRKSIELAEKRGAFPNYGGSALEKKGMPKFRNATRLCIAPTGEISMIADTSAGIEPVFALSYVKRVLDNQDFVYVNDAFRKAATENGFYSEKLVEEITNKGSIREIGGIPEEEKKVFVVAFDIESEWHVKMQAAFQKNVDLAVSKTINFPEDATIDDIESAYMSAYEMDCKGITVYRDKSRGEQILNIESAKREDNGFSARDKMSGEKNGSNDCPNCGTKMTMQEGCATCPDCGTSHCNV
ncbi:MAG: adenosylcobalamin-dependent ribonucleoside-diphosphate reductase [archaeon]